MDRPIMLSPQDFWNIMLVACACIVYISVAFAVIINIIEHFKQPDKKQDDRITNLETKVDGIEKHLAELDKQGGIDQRWHLK